MLEPDIPTRLGHSEPEGYKGLERSARWGRKLGEDEEISRKKRNQEWEKRSEGEEEGKRSSSSQNSCEGTTERGREGGEK